MKSSRSSCGDFFDRFARGTDKKFKSLTRRVLTTAGYLLQAIPTRGFRLSLA